jgi:YHS domain-containing protein
MPNSGSVFGAFDVARRTFIMGVVAVGVSLGATVGAAQAEEAVNALPDGTAMDGFDVVAYFDGAPAKGDAAYAIDYKGKTWLFSSQEHASDFAADPARYEPQHNGWCSYAVSEGYGAEVDFVNGWSVIDDKLYLNWDAETREAFLAEQSTRISQADANWPELHAGLVDGSADLYTHAGEGADISHPQQLN